MKKILLSFSFLTIAILANAQTPNFLWANSIGGSDQDYSGCIAVDKWGNTFTAGWFVGSMDVDPGPSIFTLTSTGYYGTYISKLDSDGNFVWGTNVGGTGFYNSARGITVDTLGNVYTTGYFQGTADFDPGIGTFYLTDSTSSNIPFVLKLDGAGNFVWAKSLNGSASSPGGGAGWSILLDAIGDIYVSGGYSGTLDFDPGIAADSMTASTSTTFTFILKLDAAGNFTWAKSMDGTCLMRALAMDTANNLYVTGLFSGMVDFDPSVGTFILSSIGGYDVFISKLDSAGNFVWAKSMGGILDDYGLDVAVNSSGEVFTTGFFETTADFDPGVGTYILTSAGGYDIFISKLNSSGNFMWGKNIGGTAGDQGYSIGVDAANNVYTTGSFSGIVDFDPGAGIFNLTTVGYANAFVSKLDSTGNMLWAGSIPGTSTSGSYGTQLTLDGLNNIYFVGGYNDVAAFNPFSLTSVGTEDIFICKMGALSVWPGDANNDDLVDNNDLLPIGLFYGQTGTLRSTVSNSWQEFNVADWGISQSTGADIKHVDSNGDGTIDNNDTLAVNLNFALTHAFAPINNEVRLPAADLHFVTSSGSYLSGSIVDVEIWAGDATTPVTNLYGLAFDINYDASHVQPSSESLTYPASWLGTPGTDAITISKVDALANTAYGAETRINQINSSGFGKIADFKFQLKISIPANTMMYFSVSGYAANDAVGLPVLFNTPLDSIVINPTSVSVSEINNETQISIYPNPTNGLFNVFTSQQIINGSIEIHNVIGELVFSQKIINQQNTIDLKNQASGLYFVKVISDGEVIGMKKVVKE